MKISKNYLIIAVLGLILTTPVSYQLVRFMGNLTTEYTTVLNGFIHSLICANILVFLYGVFNAKTEK